MSQRSLKICFLLFQGTRDPVGSAVLRSDRHVVAGLCDRRALPRLATLPGLVRVRPDPLHLADAGAAVRAHAQ